MFGLTSSRVICVILFFTFIFVFSTAADDSSEEIQEDFNSITCTETGFKRHPRDCAKFYRCVDVWETGEHFSLYAFSCPPNTIFDERLLVCAYPQQAFPPCGTKPPVQTTTKPEILKPTGTTTTTTVAPVEEVGIVEPTTLAPIEEAEILEQTTPAPIKEEEIIEPTTLAPIEEGEENLELITLAPEVEEEILELTTLAPGEEQEVMASGEGEILEPITLAPEEEILELELTTLAPGEEQEVLASGEGEILEPITLAPEEEEEILEQTTLAPEEEEEILASGEGEILEQTTFAPEEEEIVEPVTLISIEEGNLNVSTPANNLEKEENLELSNPDLIDSVFLPVGPIDSAESLSVTTIPEISPDSLESVAVENSKLPNFPRKKPVRFII